MSKNKVSTKEVAIIGNVLLYAGILGFLFFFATTKRVIDANIYYFAFVAAMGWFIVQMRPWARRAVMIVFSIYAALELLVIIASFNSSFRLQVPLISFISHLLWFAFNAAFVFLLMKKSVKSAFLASR